MPRSHESKKRLKERLSRYPKDWKAISKRIRERSGGRCECLGECGVGHCPRRCIERHGKPAEYANGKVVLTVAHLNHNEQDCRDENLRAMCQRCHLCYDKDHHQENARRTRAAKKGQQLIF